MGDADIRAACDLKPAAKTNAVQGCDDRNGQFTPLHRDLLKLVRIAIDAIGNLWLIGVGCAAKACRVETGTKGPPLT